MKKLFTYGLILALVDPGLLCLIWLYYGIWPAAGIVVLSPVIGGRLLLWAKARARVQDPTSNPGGVFGAVHQEMSDQVLLTFGYFLFLYPGPLTTLIGLLLLIPAARRMLTARFTRSMAKSGGGASMFPGGNGVVFTAMSGAPNFGGAVPSGGLKQAQGREVDPSDPAESPQLPQP
ncbi:MAG TPA: FxsA family protein [Planctomycetota bacterium]|jgi:UPF0716 family protein affecting phage T7 exclusion